MIPSAQYVIAVIPIYHQSHMCATLMKHYTAPAARLESLAE
jgi:hypothetical protein